MNFEDAQTHQTVLGGLVSIIVITSFLGFFLYSMVYHELYYKKDSISTTIQKFVYTDPLPAITLFDG